MALPPPSNTSPFAPPTRFSTGVLALLETIQKQEARVNQNRAESPTERLRTLKA